MLRTALLLTWLAVESGGLSVQPGQKPFTGCRRSKLLLSQLRADPKNPADSKTIDGEDCGNVKTIVAKWAKSKKVGGLAGKAKAATLAADTAAKNTDDAVARANALGKKVGLKGEIPKGVEQAAKTAEESSKAATKASTSLGTKLDSFKGKFADFAKEISNDDMVQLKKATDETITATEDAKDAAERVLQKADEAKEKAMKSTEGAKQLIETAVTDADKLSESAGEAAQKSEFAAKDVGDLITKSKALTKKLDAEIKDAKEQKPVWEAYKDDLTGREKAADDSKKAVETAITDVKKAKTALDGKTKTLKEVKDKGQADPKELLGQTKNIDGAEEATRKLEKEMQELKGKVSTLMKDGKRLDAKIKDAAKKLEG